VKVRITKQELERCVEVSARVAKRTNSEAVVHWDRIEIIPAAPTPVGAA
jgi:hypothetical protein